MISTQQIAEHFKQVHFGGNWTASNLKEQLNGVNWQQATQKIGSLNTIATLVFHINYYVGIIIKVLEGGPLEGSDKLSFNVPLIESEEQWQNLVSKNFKDAERLATLIEQMPTNKLGEIFGIEKYGNYYRNILGVIEHTHYHLGQIVLIKKLISEKGFD